MPLLPHAIAFCVTGGSDHNNCTVSALLIRQAVRLTCKLLATYEHTTRIARQLFDIWMNAKALAIPNRFRGGAEI